MLAQYGGEPASLSPAGLTQVCIHRVYSEVRLLAPSPSRTAHSPSFHLLAPSIRGPQSLQAKEASLQVNLSLFH